MEKLNVSKEHAAVLLQGLVKQGKLTLIGRGKTSRYVRSI